MEFSRNSKCHDIFYFCTTEAVWTNGQEYLVESQWPLCEMVQVTFIFQFAHITYAIYGYQAFQENI